MEKGIFMTKTQIKKRIIELFFEENISPEEITKIINRELESGSLIKCDFVVDTIKKEIKKEKENSFREQMEELAIKQKLRSQFLEMYRKLGFLESRDELERRFLSLRKI